MVCKPDSQMTIWNPTACQIDMTMIAPSAVDELPSQSTFGIIPKLTASNKLFNNPFCPS